MSEHTEYQQKLAEAIWQRAWREGKCGDAVGQIAAVLAAEDVVDPTELQEVEDALAHEHNLRMRAEQQLATLRAELEGKNHTRLDQLEIDTAKNTERITTLLTKVAEAQKTLTTLREGDSDV